MLALSDTGVCSTAFKAEFVRSELAKTLLVRMSKTVPLTIQFRSLVPVL